jgi:hypothetical protein
MTSAAVGSDEQIFGADEQLFGPGLERLRSGTPLGARLKTSLALIMNEPIDLLRCHFDLTPAEARLALHLVAGETLRSAATKLSITYETARTGADDIIRSTRTHQGIRFEACGG